MISFIVDTFDTFNNKFHFMLTHARAHIKVAVEIIIYLFYEFTYYSQINETAKWTDRTTQN